MGHVLIHGLKIVFLVGIEEILSPLFTELFTNCLVVTSVTLILTSSAVDIRPVKTL